MRTLNIKYGNGSMQINVDEFFPASKPRIRKLLKIMRMDWETDRVAELLQLLDDRVEDVRKTIAGGNIYAPKLQQKVDEAERGVQRARREGIALLQDIEFIKKETNYE